MKETRDSIQELVKDCLNGDKKAEYGIYKKYASAMYNVSLRMLKNKEEAEDIMHDSFIDAFSRLGQFRFESTFGAWLKSITINNCLNRLRKLQNDKLFEPVFKEDFHDTYDSELELEAKFKVEAIKKAMHALPTGYRVVLNLYLFENYDHKEIGQILGISESTSKSQYSRAKKKLLENLNTRSWEN